MATDLHDLSIVELSRLIAARTLSPVELVEALIQRVEQYDAQTHAFITRTFDLARRQAREAEVEIAAGRRRGALHGIPFALKDIYDTRGILTSGHSRVFIDRIPAEDATATGKLYEAGAVLLGKLATHEMAHAGPSFDLPWPPARNPWNLAHFTGGSSSGSGAAVAAGLVPVALGSDTGGSIRGPASLCGVVGLMPTFGLVSRAGVITNSYTFDHCGPLARTVEDCALVLQALAGYDPKDAGSLRRPIPDYRQALGEALRGLKIGWARSSKSAGCGRSGSTSTSRSSSPRARSSASTRRTSSPGPRTSAPTSARARCLRRCSPPTTTCRPRASIAG
jgi:aspartyl-tRNA(Asn)/glutamyl-tRNA(Gln) amidotransferase subunit A